MPSRTLGGVSPNDPPMPNRRECNKCCVIGGFLFACRSTAVTKKKKKQFPKMANSFPEPIEDYLRQIAKKAAGKPLSESLSVCEEVEV